MINKKIAGNIIVVLLSLLLVFHGLILFGILPQNIVWAGQNNDVFQLEIFAILLTSVFLIIALSKSGYIKDKKLRKISDWGIWIMIAYFSFNVIANLFAETIIEKVIFIPVSLILVICSVKLILKR